MNGITFDSDRAMTVLGVPGRLTHRTCKPGQAPGLWFKQRWISEQRPIAGYGPGGKIRVTIRFDDELGNGHNDFAITAEVTTPESLRRRDIAAAGCLHEDIAAVFPELAPLIKWHLTSTDGPMHYVANTCYHASDRDHYGLLKGEKRQIRSGRTGLPAWNLVAVGPDGEEVELYELEKNIDADEQPPCAYRLEYRPWWRVGEGKSRNLAAARECAVWPEATDEQLTAPRAELEAALLARLPELLSQFRAAMESIGFYWSPGDFPATDV